MSKLSLSVRNNVHRKYKSKCGNCGGTGEHIHHIVPISLGGSNNIGNLVLLCADCHHKIHDISALKGHNLTKEVCKKYREQGISTRSGKWWGRQPVTLPENYEEIYEKYFRKIITRQEAEELLGIKTTTFYKYMPNKK